jgi:hypothetical protein
MIEEKNKEMNLALAKNKYIQLVLSYQIKVMGVKRDILKEQIKENGLEEFIGELTKMLLTSLTEEESQRLEKVYEDLKKEIEELSKLTPNDLWMKDLMKLKEFLNPLKRSENPGSSKSDGKRAKLEGAFHPPVGHV